MKKIYEKPQLEVLELLHQDALLLPASGGGSTDEALSRGFDFEDEEVTAPASRGYRDIWDDEEEEEEW